MSFGPIPICDMSEWVARRLSGDRAVEVSVPPASFSLHVRIPSVRMPDLSLPSASTCGLRLLVGAAVGGVAYRYNVLWFRTLVDSTVWEVRQRLTASLTVRYNEKGLRAQVQNSMRETLPSELVNVVPRTHSHPLAASQRTAAKRMMDRVAMRLGLTVFEVSPSVHDLHLPHYREYYHVKDLATPHNVNTTVPENAVIRMVDVDYYADMRSWLYHCKPVFLYTFMPIQLNGSDLNSYFDVGLDNKVRVIVAGGERYTHELWDYHVTTICVPYWNGTAVFDVDSYTLPGSEHRRVVAMTPRSWTWGPFADDLEAVPLRRLVVADGVTRRLDVVNEHGAAISSIGVDIGGSIMLAKEDLERMIKRFQREPSALSMPAVERALRQCSPESKTVASDATLLFDYLYTRAGRQFAIATTFFTPGIKAPHYTATEPCTLDDGKTYARMITRPLGEHPGVPASSYNNDVACVAGRIEKVRNDVDPPTAFYRYATEFLERLVPSSLLGKGQPFEPDEVARLQTEPRQRVRYDQWKLWPVAEPMRVKSFQKHESYQTVNDPRNISTVPTDHTVRLSQYTLPFSQVVLKGKDAIFPGHKWYMPGLNPLQIAERLRSFLQDKKSVLVVDYSRLDGTISQFLRELELGAYMRFYNDDPEARALIKKEWNAPARTKHGLAYRPGFSRLSGSPLTTDGNTIICGFVAYCINREHGMDAVEAWDRIGLIYGDDGILFPGDATIASRTASALGLSLKVDNVREGDSLKYLGRLFIDPWSSLMSVQDPSRCLARIHLTMTSDNVPIEVAAQHRAQAFLVTDANTPILAEWCRYVQRTYPMVTDFSRYERFLDLDTPYHGTDSVVWPQPPIRHALTLSRVAEDLGMMEEEVLAAQAALRMYPSRSWPKLPLTTEIKIAAQFDGELRQPGDHKSILDISKEPSNIYTNIPLHDATRQASEHHPSSSIGVRDGHCLRDTSTQASAESSTNSPSGPIVGVPPSVNHAPETSTAAVVAAGSRVPLPVVHTRISQPASIVSAPPGISLSRIRRQRGNTASAEPAPRTVYYGHTAITPPKPPAPPTTTSRRRANRQARASQHRSGHSGSNRRD